jgi:acyl-CoA reductase-like NAD-dependent aldehyde dehydrogenase
VTRLLGTTMSRRCRSLGSTSVGRRIHDLASRRLARIQLEMGGKNPFVVAEDATPAAAAALIAQGGWGLTGQACTATSRVIAVGGATSRWSRH